MGESLFYVLIFYGVVLSSGVSMVCSYMFVMYMYLDLLRWIFIIGSSVFCMLMLADICSGVYVMLSLIGVVVGRLTERATDKSKVMKVVTIH